MGAPRPIPSHFQSSTLREQSLLGLFFPIPPGFPRLLPPFPYGRVPAPQHTLVAPQRANRAAEVPKKYFTQMPRERQRSEDTSSSTSRGGSRVAQSGKNEREERKLCHPAEDEPHAL